MVYSATNNEGPIVMVESDKSDSEFTDGNNESDGTQRPGVKPEIDDFIFLLMGVDSGDIEKEFGIRTDTIMLMRLNFDSGDIKILSIPRDTRVKIKGAYDKVNHAHSYGGVKLALETISDFLGHDIDNYVKVDYRAVETLVDELGGVEVEVPFKMEYYDPTVNFRVDLEAGKQVLDGDKAMQFLRWRHDNNFSVQYEDGDLGRIETQKYFLKEFINQSLAPKNIMKLPSLIRTGFNHVETNIPISKLLKMAYYADDFKNGEIETSVIPGETEKIDSLWYYTYYPNGTQTMVDEFFE